MRPQTSEGRRQLRFRVIEKYLASGLTQKQFCQQENLIYSTFQLWLKKYRQAHGDATHKPSPSGNNFVPLTFQSSAGKADYTIEYPNGVVLHIRRAIELPILIQLIQAKGA